MNSKALSLIKKLVLQNAVKFGGKASPGAIVGGVLGDFPELKDDMKSLMSKINEIVKEVNSFPPEKQREELIKLDPSAMEKKEHIVDIFGFLNIKEGQKIRTAFPPGPEKYPHIGHAKALLLNYLLAQKYGGEFYLRFEDTNPELVKKEFYQIMQEDFKWLGVKWDKLICASDHMDLFYKHSEELIEKGLAYACSCSSEEIKLGREKGTKCKCRENSEKKNLDLWKKMNSSIEPGGAIIRLKIDLKHKNSTMRDPAIFRIIETEHARHGTKYRVWPNYDFQNAIMDGYFKITHRLRTKEFEMRNELQRYIQKILGYEETHIYEFARFNLEGVESSGRKIREKIAKGELVGWDDPSLTTLVALRRRGFQPEAIREFVIKTGITKNEATLTWDDLIVHNKRYLDEHSNRYFFVCDPVKIRISHAPEMNIKLNLHPAHRKGGRNFTTDENFLVSKKDYDEMKKEDIYRFIECFNFEFKGKDKFEYLDNDLATFKNKGKRMLHYLPEAEENVPIKILMPTKQLVEGLAEKGVLNIKEGEVVQFERFGFARLDSKKDMIFWFTH